MKWFSSKKKAASPTSHGYVMPSDSELLEKLRNFEEINQRVAEFGKQQQAMRKTPEQGAAANPQAFMDKMRANITVGGLSYLASPPADLPDRAPDAAQLWMDGAFIGSMKGDDAYSLDRFNQALAIIRQIGHRTAEARLLYNVGVAHYKLGDREAAISTLLEGKNLAQESARELGREARKVQRFEEEMKTENPRIDVAGVPHIEQAILEKYLEALATVYEADSQASKAADCRDEIKRLNLESVE